MTDIEIELQHLWLEVNSQRWSQVRRFLFSYVCYREGWLSKNNAPCWERARDAAPTSLQVKIRQSCKLLPLVPEKELTGLIKRLAKAQSLDLSSLKDLLDKQLQYVCITGDEYERLDSAGLSEKMPKEWYQSPTDPWCRFNLVGIQVTA